MRPRNPTIPLLLCCVLVAGCGSDETGTLIEQLKAEDPEARRDAAKNLGERKDPRAVEPLIAALKDTELPVQCAAAEALGRIKDRRAVVPLVSLLERVDWAACPPAVEHTKNALGSDWAHQLAVARAAIQALGEIGFPAVEALLGIASDGPTPAWCREWAVEVLGKTRDARAIGPLVGLLRDKELNVRCAAAEALKRIGMPAVEALIPLLDDHDPQVRRQAVTVFAGILVPFNDPNAVLYLLKAMNDEDPGVRCEAAQALARGRVPIAGTEDVLLSLLRKRSEDGAVRMCLAETLCNLRTPKASKYLDEAMRDGDLAVIAGACQYFVAKGEPGTEDVLLRALRHSPHPNVKMEECLRRCGNAKLRKGVEAIPEQWSVASQGSGVTEGELKALPKWGEKRSKKQDQ